MPVGLPACAHPRGLPVSVQEVSRRVWGLRLRRTYPGLALSPRLMRPSAESDRVGVLIARFRSSIPSPPIPLAYASPVSSRWPTQNSGPSGSLLLYREALASSTPCRFIPAHHQLLILNRSRKRAPNLRVSDRDPDSGGPGSPISFASYRWQKHYRGLYQTPIVA